MPEYIEREKALQLLNKNSITKKITLVDGVSIYNTIEKIPTADVVEVVRCKDCEHWGGIIYGFVCRKFSGIETKICMHADDFCSYGERKEVDNGHP